MRTATGLTCSSPPAAYAASASLRDWKLRMDGSWNLADVWLGPGNGM